MLKLKKHYTPSLPTMLLGSRRLAMSPVLSEDDELIEAIDGEKQTHDDNWTLDPVPDTDELSQYWNTVESDIENDPEWIKFDDD